MSTDRRMTPPAGQSKCTKRRTNGDPCKAWAIPGLDACKHHAGMTPAKARAKGQVALEAARWTLDGDVELRDPGEVMLRLVTQSAARVELYARLLGEAYDAAERLRQAHEAGSLLVAAGSDDDDDVAEAPAVQTARADLNRIFGTGGVGALIGLKYDADRHGRIYATEEGIRGLAKLEADERDRCASFAAKAIAAGLAERQVRLAEAQGAAMYAVFARVLEGLGLSVEQAALVPVLLAREIGSLTGSRVIDGAVAS